MFFLKKRNAVTDEEAMRQVMSLMDDWGAPEPSPWFDARMHARLREQQRQGPESLLSRLQAHWLFMQPVNRKPLMVGALALLVLAGGSGYWQTTRLHPTQAPAMSATVQDLQVLDSNAQAIQQMDQLLDDNDDSAPQI